MAELAKKLHFLKDGTEQTAKAYSTTGEVGSSYITNKIDGVTCYIPIGSTDDSRATKGRVIKGGTTYAILATGKPPYTEILEHPSSANGGGAGDGINSLYSRTGTFVVPEGVTRVRVAMCSGGKSSSSNGVGNSWQSSYFGSIDSSANATNWCRGCNASFTFKDYNTNNPGFVTDQYGGSSKSGNGRWGAPYRSGDGTSGYYTGYVDVKPGQSIAWRAGRGGNKAGVGFILIAYGGDI